jgi:uncharacterized protein (TIGR03435 family)
MNRHIDRGDQRYPAYSIAARILPAIGALVMVTVAAGGVQLAAPLQSQSQTVGAQAPSGATIPTFEVASVKPNKSGDGRMMLGIQPGGRFTATNVPLRTLIRNAYQLQDFQIVGGPGWIASDRFDILAKAEGNLPPAPPGGPPGPLQLMLRALLAERFSLVVHEDTRELPTYALVLARADGKLGPQLRGSDIDCAQMAGARGRGGPPVAAPQPGERPPCGIRIGPGQMSAGGLPLSQFATALSPFVQRVIVDRTGLAGNFDVDLRWTPDQMPQGAPPPGAPPLPPINPNGPSIFTAVQEQLGLKLESERSPVSVLVIDKVEQPMPD